jgi:hypothetical protein
MTSPFDPRLRILNYNTHVGVTLRGAVRFLLDTQDPHLVVLQEVQSPRARLAARRVFLPHLWLAAGTRPASMGRGSAGTLIFARRSVFRLIASSNDLITPFRDSFHPERRCTTAQYLHRPTEQILDIGAVHLWTLKNASTFPVVRTEHLAQLRAHVDSAVRARRAGRLPFRAGDFNEHISGRGGSPAEREMAAANLRPARPANDHARRIDEIFVPDELACDDYRAVTVPSHFAGVEGSHKALVVDVKIPHRIHQPQHPLAGQGAGHHP